MGDSVITSAPTMTTATVTEDDISISIGISTDEHGDHTDDDHETHTDEEGTGTLAPSPTESVGCEAHGNHWYEPP